MANDVYASLGKDRKRFLNWQWRVIAVTMIGYAVFYFVRKNMSVAMPGITAELSSPAHWCMVFHALSMVTSLTV